MTNEEKAEMMRKAIAVYFDCDESEIGNFIFGCERESNGEAMFSSGWSQLPHWVLLGFVNEIRETLNRQRQQAQTPKEEIIEVSADELPPDLRAMLEGR